MGRFGFCSDCLTSLLPSAFFFLWVVNVSIFWPARQTYGFRGHPFLVVLFAIVFACSDLNAR